ncbi:surface-adhesin E family protein [Chromobacterium sp. TRC.1.1.SA]|uniref:Surface-adhesin E family protein n=1 Tax=Chromobacterium indicum TaxID=3110228 RepID=A0ABV0CEW3_9NEIS
MKKTLIAALMLLSGSAFAASWSATYYNVKSGTLLVDTDSIVENGGTTKFWTTFAPTVDYNRPSAGYAYNMTLRNINCKSHTVAYAKSIYYDFDQVPHDATVADKSTQEIIPDSENDYLWKYVCQPDARKDLAAPVSNIKEYLRGHAEMAKQYDFASRAKQ